MPVISMFFGIIITMNADDHVPPHIHARYQGHEASFTSRSACPHGPATSTSPRNASAPTCKSSRSPRASAPTVIMNCAPEVGRGLLRVPD